MQLLLSEKTRMNFIGCDKTTAYNLGITVTGDV